MNISISAHRDLFSSVMAGDLFLNGPDSLHKNRAGHFRAKEHCAVMIMSHSNHALFLIWRKKRQTVRARLIEPSQKMVAKINK